MSAPYKASIQMLWVMDGQGLIYLIKSAVYDFIFTQLFDADLTAASLERQLNEVDKIFFLGLAMLYMSRFGRP